MVYQWKSITMQQLPMLCNTQCGDQSIGNEIDHEIGSRPATCGDVFLLTGG